ncbi:MAG: hypothetical protein IPL50_17630 [Chitinophagaceae bacterium]|nr:hypothetical protein [Chitinophagaceae bacterium]
MIWLIEFKGSKGWWSRFDVCLEKCLHFLPSALIPKTLLIRIPNGNEAGKAALNPLSYL